MNTPTPNDIIDLSNTNTIVHRCMQYWKEGYITWDQFLMMSVVLLDGQNKELEKSAIKSLDERRTINHYQ